TARRARRASCRSRTRRRRTSRSRVARNRAPSRSAKKRSSKYAQQSAPPSPVRRTRDKRSRMIKLYHAPLTRSIRVLWLLEELGIPYELEGVAFQPPKVPFSQPTPYGKVPAIRDGDVEMIE